MEVESVSLASLELDPENTRNHSRRNLDAIKTSLERFGQQKPIVVDEDGRVVAGNGTLEAARDLGWATIEITRTGLEDNEKRAFSIADNQTAALADWNDEALAQALADIKNDPSIDELVTGFNAAEVERAIRGLGDSGRDLDDPDNAPDPPETPVSKPGDLWVLGDHRLLCGDSTNADDVARVMDGEKAVLLSTDPPYCVKYSGADRPMDSGKDWTHLYKEIEIEDLGEFLRAVLTAVLPNLTDNAAIYVWHSHLQYPVIDRVLEEFDILRHQPLIWSKPSSTFTRSYYRWSHEPCIFGWRRGNKPPRYLAQEISTVWDVDWEGRNRIVGNEHPTQKPIRLFEIPMEQHTREGEIVLEPFSGSGSHLIAAEKLRRRCRAIEVQPAFVDVAINRWQEATGGAAVLGDSGKTFADVAAERGGAKEP